MTARRRDSIAPIRLYLAQRRQAAGLTQADLARRLHVTPGAVSFWESGTRTPPADRLADWAAALGIRLTLQELTCP